jgi:hypothetical protein
MLQYWKDDDFKVPYSFKTAVVEKTIEWASAMGIDDIRIVARNEQVAQIFEKVYGFERSGRIIMNTSLKKFVGRCADRQHSDVDEGG